MFNQKKSKLMQTKGQLMKSLNTAFSFAPPSILSLTIYLSVLNDFFECFPRSFVRSFVGKANRNNSCQLAVCSDKIHQLIIGKTSICNPQSTYHTLLLSESYFQSLHLWTANHIFQPFAFHFQCLQMEYADWY